MLAPRNGRPPEASFTLSYRRDLREQDFARPQAGDLTSGSIIQRLKHRHHTAARGIASGLRDSEVATLTGYSPTRISDLQKDPAFIELVTQYQNEIGDRMVDAAVEFQTRLLDLSREAVGELQDRFDDDEIRKKIPTSEVRQIAQFGLDRTVAPPKTAQPQAPTPTKITFNMGTKTLRDEDDRAEGAEYNTITIEANSPTLITTDLVEQNDDTSEGGSGSKS